MSFLNTAGIPIGSQLQNTLGFQELAKKLYQNIVTMPGE